MVEHYSTFLAYLDKEIQYNELVLKLNFQNFDRTLNP